MDYLQFWTNFILHALVVYRISEIITIDTISQQIRAKIGKMATRKYSPMWYVSELAHCPYCVGVWLSLSFAILACRSLKEIIIYWLALSGMQALLESVSNGRD